MRLSTITKLFGFALIAAFCASAAINWMSLRELKVKGPIYEQIVAGKDLVADALPPPLFVIEAYLEASLLVRDPSRAATAKERVARLYKEYMERHDFWKQQRLPADIATPLFTAAHAPAASFWTALNNDLIPAAERGDRAALDKAFVAITEAFETHRAGIDAVVAAANANNTAIEAAAEVSDGRYMALMIAAAVAGIGIVIACITGIQLLLLKPILRLGRRMDELAKGDLEQDIVGVGRRDEVGEMANAVVVFRDAGRQKLVMEAEARRVQDGIDRERAETEAARAEAARTQAGVVQQLGDGLSRLAQRDLTVALAGFPVDYKQIESDFNGAVAALRETMSIVANNSAAILSGSAEITIAADDLSKRTEQQAASLEETAAALDQITATGKKAAEGAGHARNVVTAAKGDAEKAGSVVRKTVEAMDGIEKSAQQITQIIGVIDEIAFQTNLLALNAGVEAARAGDAGRGFAVVASEVRALAQRSAGAAKEIKALISTSSAQVAEGVSLVAETGDALERILRQVNDINAAVLEIAAGAQEQATGLQEVNTAINQMDQMTQQNASMVEESTAASHSLKQEASQLSDLIRGFRIGAEPATPQPAAVVPMGRKSAPNAIPQLKTTGQGAAALKEAPDDWREF